MIRTQTKHLKPILASIVGESNVSSGKSVLATHGKDCSHHPGQNPDLVVWPTKVEQVQEIARFCNNHKLAIIPYGTGTGLEGGIMSTQKGGICVNLQKLDKVQAFHPQDFDVKVQPGVTRKALNHYIKDEGLWFPIDPGADASLCGMCATGASGTNAVKYGTMKENTLNLEVVLANGDLIETAGIGMRSRKSSAGYDLTRLFVGSEGTLGIITSATLKLHGRPEVQASTLASFSTVEKAISAVLGILQASIPIARLEFLDTLSMQMCNAYSKTDYEEKPTLFMEIHGTPMSVKEQFELVRDICCHCQGSNDLKLATKEEDRKRLWKARHEMHWAIRKFDTSKDFHGTDVCVPISRLPEAIRFCENLFSTLGVKAPLMGHVGDGNLHCSILFDPEADKNDPIRFSHEKAAEMLANHAISLGGTCTGEHGIGLGKKSLLRNQFGPYGIQAMRAIKNALDPLNIMNPGKIL